MDKLKIVCELSGGADSICAAIIAKKRWLNAEFYGVFIDYGQVCSKQEYGCAKEAAEKLCLEFKVIEMKNIWSGGGMISGESKEDVNVYTPLRNVAILGTVMAYADSLNADIIITGSKGLSKIVDDEYSYYDSTLPFYKLMEGVWYYTTESKRKVKIIPILAEGRTEKMSKEEVYRVLLKEGFKYEDTWSCFKGGIEECGECYNCEIKKEIFKKLKC